MAWDRSHFDTEAEAFEVAAAVVAARLPDLMLTRGFLEESMTVDAEVNLRVCREREEDEGVKKWERMWEIVVVRC
mgnify:CR=1 FL=1